MGLWESERPRAHEWRVLAQRRGLALALSLGAAGAAVMGAGVPALASGAASARSTPLCGSVATYTARASCRVPSGVTEVRISAAGAPGGSIKNSVDSQNGGNAGTVSGLFRVSAGDTLNVGVDVGGGASGGHGAGKGGGASYVEDADATASSGGKGVMLLVAGGGGGAAVYPTYYYTDGGDAGHPSGGSGSLNDGPQNGTGGGLGGTQTTGGGGGSKKAQSGRFLFGGAGAPGGGGGGGGYYGGGGGGYDAGGGGGSDYVEAGVTAKFGHTGDDSPNVKITLVKG